MFQLEALLRGKSSKRWGFKSLPVQNSDGTYVLQDVARVDMQAHEAREWTVTLTSFQFAGGNATPSQFPPVGLTTPPRNQTVTFPLWAANVTWGVDGATDTCLVDYPAQGCTFQVHAAVLQVSISTRQPVVVGTPVDIPIIGCFISPSRRSAIGPIANPSLTFPIQVAASDTRDLAIPPRAVAYRRYAQGQFLPNPVANQVRVIQQGTDQSQFPVQNDGSFPTGILTSGSADTLAANAAGYVRINTRAQYLTVVNTSAVSLVDLVFEFLLDLG